MSAITAIMIDSREPDSIKNLKFNNIPTIVTFLETGDVHAVTDDNHTLLIERKTPEDFLGSLKDDRLLPQLARMAEARNIQQLAGQAVTTWPYLVITEMFRVDYSGKIITDRGVTGWSFAAVMGAILSIQEMGVFVVFANGANDYQDCILRIGRRNRTNEMQLLPPRPANIFGPKAVLLAALPGIGIERVQELLDWSGDNISHALCGITDMSIPAPIGKSLRQNIRTLFGLEDDQTLEVLQQKENAT